ncbi:N4-gp56 family major capsid protein [Planococcus sp. ANT_H30]|uniref:phage major capsid protein n=1 Tax=Planococcus TaxID=1372 RepID=UPI0011EC777B|nr:MULTISPECIES: N4-gp56 family major capsid protein [Planococcus]KAA0957699.1 N4-gp56 family major capsid protein [Planococcus sp. ANT_H30]MCH4825782.1 N4-gp56 family major capsid protein [Planococcus halocryophilus]
MTQTKKANLVNVEVFADAVTSKIPGNLKLYPLAFVQNFENEQSGSISVPQYEYIGDADVVAEGVAIDPTLLTANSVPLAIEKVAKAVEITDEAAKGSFGDPVGEAEDQLTASITAGIENKMFAALATATLSHPATGALTGDVVIDAVALYGENQDGEKTLVVNPSNFGSVRKDENYADGKIFDLDIVVSAKVPAGTAYVVKPGAVGLYMSKDVDVEDDRNILTKATVLSADAHFATHLRDASKVVKITLA